MTFKPFSIYALPLVPKDSASNNIKPTTCSYDPFDPSRPRKPLRPEASKTNSTTGLSLDDIFSQRVTAGGRMKLGHSTTTQSRVAVRIHKPPPSTSKIEKLSLQRQFTNSLLTGRKVLHFIKPGEFFQVSSSANQFPVYASIYIGQKEGVLGFWLQAHQDNQIMIKEAGQLHPEKKLKKGLYGPLSPKTIITLNSSSEHETSIILPAEFQFRKLKQLIQQAYEILGTSPKSSKMETKKAYKTLAKTHHVDITQSQDTTIFQKVSEAWSLIKWLNNWN